MNKAKLTVTGVGPQPRQVDLRGETVIGRSAQADVRIEGDLVSRRHARVFPREGGWWVEDLGSRNGTLLNGARVSTAELHPGDVLMIGYGKLVFEEGRAGGSGFEVSLVEGADVLRSAVLAQGEEGESSPATVVLSYKDLVVVNQRITTAARISQRLATLLDRDELLGEVMATLFELYPQADRGCVMLRDAGEFHVAATKVRAGAAAGEGVVSISSALVDLVRRERKAVLSADTARDARFAGKDSLVGAAGRSVMVAPLQHERAFYGVVFLETSSLRQPFTANDLNLLQGIAGPVAVCLKNAELVSRIERETTLRTSLSRYLSPDVVRQIGEGALSPDLGGAQAEGTVMFSDIVGFTAMSERLAPAEVVERLNRYFTSMLDAIFGWGGTVDKFGGDAILAVWGAPVSTPEHAVRATGAALEMQARLFALNLALAEAGEPEIRMAVGLNSGRFVAGNIGGAERIEWTVIGDAVNLAQRVEALGFRGSALVSESTFRVLPAAGAWGFPPVQVRNRAEPVATYSVRALATQRGVVAAIPGELRAAAGTLPAMVAGCGTEEGRRHVEVHAAGAPEVGEAIEFAARLPEAPAALRLEGRVVASSPLAGCRTGRVLDVEAASVEAALERLLDVRGTEPASVPLERIER